MKELKVQQLFDEKYSYRQIAKEAQASVKDVSNYSYRIPKRENLNQSPL
jgi:hypothetical protein